MPFVLHIIVKALSALNTYISGLVTMFKLMGFQVLRIVTLIVAFITRPHFATVDSLMFITFSLVFEPFVALSTLMLECCKMALTVTF